jgi:MarR family transcriptional regulator for hemolysin
MGIEEPTLAGLLDRLQTDGWVKRRNAANDRRCKTVHLLRPSNPVLTQIFDTAHDLRHELMAEIPERDLQTCARVLNQIRERAERAGVQMENGRARARRKKR